mgnify:CR=1 FL=1
MRILACSDIHSSLKSVRVIKKKAARADIIICAGDVSVFDRDLDRILFELNKTGKPVLVIPGNHDSNSAVRSLCKIFRNITYFHRKAKLINGVFFMGFGNSGFEMRDKKFEKWASNTIKFGKNTLRKARKVVLFTHGPPFNTKLDRIMNHHCGSWSIAALIEKLKPDLYVCGHLHENFNKQEKRGKTRLVNPGPEGRVLVL